MNQAMMKQPLKLDNFIDIKVKLGEPIKIGQTNQGYLKIIPILGGTFEGKISGTVLNWGGDVNYKYNSKESTANATYVLQTSDSQKILVHNKAIINKDRPMLTYPTFSIDKKSQIASLLDQMFIGKIIPVDKYQILIKVYACK